MNKQTCLGLITLTFVALITLSACHTIKGLGQDVESGGKAIQKTSNETQKKSNCKTHYDQNGHRYYTDC